MTEPRKIKARLNALKLRLTSRVWEGSCLYGECETMTARIEKSQEILDEMRDLMKQFEEVTKVPEKLIGRKR